MDLTYRSILFRVDANAKIGIGHLMRCLTLANKLKDVGCNVKFLMHHTSGSAKSLIINNSHNLSFIDGDDFDFDIKKTIELVNENLIDLVVVDHYSLDARWEKIIKGENLTLIAIDDLANREHNCDYLIDSTHGRELSHYREKIDNECITLLGSEYCLLRPDFSELRSNAIDKRNKTKAIQTIMVSFGGTDVKSLTIATLQYLNEAGYLGRVIILTSQSCSNILDIKNIVDKNTNFSLFIDTSDVASLMLESDLVIGGMGTSSWERCCLGLPSISLVLAENQRENADRLQALGAVILADENNYLLLLREYLSTNLDLNKWMSISKAGFRLVDGKGCLRVISKIFTDIVSLTPFQESFSEILFKWQSEVGSRRFSRDKEPPKLNDHLIWVNQSLSSQKREMWIITYFNEAVGYVRLDDIGEFKKEISILISSKFRGLSIAEKAINLLLQSQLNFEVMAYIEPENIASIKMFEKCKFTKVDDFYYRWTSLKL